jgi:hypothetical protein
MHAIAKDPGKRYATAATLATAIRSAMAAPEDVENVGPDSRVNVAVDTTDAHAETIPAPLPSDHPPPARIATPMPSTVRPLSREGFSRTWVLVCVVAAAVGIAVGAWLSLKN